VVAATRRDLQCEVSSVAIEFPADRAAAKVEHLRLGSLVALRQAQVSLEFENNSPKPVVRIFVVLQFLRKDTSPLISIPIRAAVDQQTSRESWAWQELKSPIRQSERITLVGESPYLLLDCNLRAVTSFVQITYADGTEAVVLGESWRIPPLLKTAPEIELARLSLARDITFRAILQIGDDGSLLSIRAIDGGTPETVSWLQINRPKWSFVPAVQAGKQVSTEIEAVLHFHRNGQLGNLNWLPPQTRRSGKALIIDLFLPASTMTQGDIYFGGSLPLYRIHRTKYRAPIGAGGPPFP
jgi:hypothetical protein